MAERPANRRIHVCMIMPSYYPVVGGMETQVERLVPFLRRHGVDCSVLTRQPYGAAAREVRDGVRIERVRVSGGPGLRSVSFTARGTSHIALNRRRIDVLHAHSIMSPSTIAALSGLLFHKPRVVTLHARYEPDHLLSKPFGAARLRLYRRVIDRFVAITEDIESLLQDQQVPGHRVIRIPNGIDTSRFAPAAPSERAVIRQELNLPTSMPLAVFVGRLHPVKQVDVLLRAWAAIDNGNLVILGDGEDRTRLEALLLELGLERRVELRGMVDNVEAYLRAADVFALPSSSEGLSVALLEAMSCGVVPVATAVGGAVGLIDTGMNGILVTSGDPHELASALRHALTNELWRVRAASAARETVIERFDLDAVARQLADVYRSVLR